MQPADDAESEVALRGWKRPASRLLDDFDLAEPRRSVGAAELTLLDSQSGAFAARVLTVRPTVPELAVGSAPFRMLLHRRLRLPLPLAPARNRCLRTLDVLGDHVAACPRSGTSRQRGGPLERAAARVCREAGAAVATNVLVRDLNLQAEVIANGLFLRGGSQLAVDTTQLGHSAAAVGPPPAQPLQMPAEARNAPTLSSGGRRGAAWSFSAWRLADTGVLKLLAVAAARSARFFPASLLSLRISNTANVNREPPLLRYVLADSAESPPLASRLALCVCVCVKI